MFRSHLFARMLVLALTVGAAGTAAAEAPPPSSTKVEHRGGHGRHHARLTPEERAQKKREIAQKIDTLLIVELSSRLSLSDEKTLKLKDALARGREARESRRAAVDAEREKLRALVSKNAPDAELLAQQKKLLAAMSQPDDHTLFTETAKFLTPREQSELHLVLPELKDEVKDMVREARGKGGMQGADRMERMERREQRRQGGNR